MSMTNNGLSKLTEELGETGQVIGKMLQYPECQMDRDLGHPDGVGPLPQRLEDELGDLEAAAEFVAGKLNLDVESIARRKARKLALFRRWDSGDDAMPVRR